MSGRARHLAREDAARAALRVRELRRQRGWSQRELALKAGVAQATVSLVELGRQSVSVAVVARVAGALGLDTAGLAAECGRCGGSPRPWNRCLACGAEGDRT